MQIRNVWRLIAIALMLGGLFSVPLLDAPSADVVARVNDKDNGNGNKGKSEEKKADKEKDKKEQDEVISDSGGYRVEVDCMQDDNAGTSTCTFTGVVPEGGKKINHLDVPQESVCADVIGGEYKPIESDPHTGVTGYQTKGSNDTVTLVLDGHVVPGSTTTYWIKAASAIMPITGPGLNCAVESQVQLEAPAIPASPTATPTPLPTTGELVVLIYRCTDVPEDRTDYDWFGLCDPEAGVQSIELAPVSEFSVEPQLVDSDASGDVTFGDLEPGLYSLELAGGTWCKAFSDNVDPEGNVIIEAGQRTTVYGFTCEREPAA